MSIVVQKYGGSSLSDAAAIKRVARRIVETKKQGNDVVVAVSAMGDTTNCWTWRRASARCRRTVRWTCC